MKKSLLRFLVIIVFQLYTYGIIQAQTFNAGPVTVQPGGTTCLNFNVNVPPPLSNWAIGDPVLGPWPVAYISNVCMNILTSHPWTLEITLTSPAGTTLTLSSFNGAGGTDYTNTCFTPFSSNIIVGQPAPFTGNFQPQQFPPGFQAFYGQGLNGVWQLCITDTLTDSTSIPLGPPWNGAASTASGTMAVGGAACNPNCNYPNWQNLSIGICAGSGAALEAIYSFGGWNVYYMDSNFNPVPDPSNVTIPGVYTIYGQDACWEQFMLFGCDDQATVTLTGTQYNLGLDQTISICQGSSTNLNSLFTLSGVTYSWTHNGIPITNTAASSVTLPGTYEIIGSNLATCDDTAQVIVTVEPKPNLGPDQTINSCSMATYDLTLTYNTTGLTTVWTRNGVVVPNPASVSVNGTYQLIVTSPVGCKDTAIVTLNISLGPALGPDQNVDYCAGTSVNLTTIFNTAGFTNVWTNFGAPVSNPSNVTAPGLYTVISSNSAGCRDTANVILNQIASPVLGPNQNLNFCANETVDLNSLFNVTGLTTTWTLNGTHVANPGAISNSGNYLLNATNSTGCSSQANAVLTSVAAPVLGPNQNTSFCPGETTDLTALFATAGLTATWTLNGSTVTNPSAINTAGTYQLIATNSTGCPDTAFANVTASSSPVIGPDQQATSCEGTPVNLNSFYNAGGNSVSWTTNNNPVPNPGNVTAAGIYTITLTNATGCTASASVNLSLYPKPDLGSDQDVSLCPGTVTDISTLFPVTGLATSWSMNGIAGIDPTNIATAGIYQLIVTDGNGCSDTAFAEVVISNGPDLGNDQSFELCDWMNLDLNTVFNISGLSAVWTYNGQPIQQTTVHDSGSYVIVVTDQGGCTDEAGVMISNIFCECEADFVYDGKCMQEPVNFTLLADSAVNSVLWQFSFPGMQSSTSINPAIKFLTSEIVEVTLTANLSCGTKEIKKNVIIDDCSVVCPVFFPSAFTPNKDGTNDRFGPFMDCSPLEYALEIRNRFGQLVFLAEQPGHTWDGKHNNLPVPEGIYVYTVKYKVPYQSKKMINGTLSLLR